MTFCTVDAVESDSKIVYISIKVEAADSSLAAFRIYISLQRHHNVTLKPILRQQLRMGMSLRQTTLIKTTLCLTRVPWATRSAAVLENIEHALIPILTPHCNSLPALVNVCHFQLQISNPRSTKVRSI